MASQQSKPVLAEPNQFRLKGYDIEISYDTTSFTATPRFSLIRQGQTLNFSDGEIQSELTQLGQMATVNLTEKRSLVSQSLTTVGVVETLTLLIPIIKVPSTSETVPIQTIAIFNQQSPHAKTVGQSQIYMTIHLFGTANQIQF
jgi:hypothetical protein